MFYGDVTMKKYDIKSDLLNLYSNLITLDTDLRIMYNSDELSFSQKKKVLDVLTYTIMMSWIIRGIIYFGIRSKKNVHSVILRVIEVYDYFYFKLNLRLDSGLIKRVHKFVLGDILDILDEACKIDSRIVKKEYRGW